jgi:hypothetical protein
VRQLLSNSTVISTLKTNLAAAGVRSNIIAIAIPAKRHPNRTSAYTTINFRGQIKIDRPAYQTIHTAFYIVSPIVASLTAFLVSDTDVIDFDPKAPVLVFINLPKVNIYFLYTSLRPNDCHNCDPQARPSTMQDGARVISSRWRFILL